MTSVYEEKCQTIAMILSLSRVESVEEIMKALTATNYCACHFYHRRWHQLKRTWINEKYNLVMTDPRFKSARQRL